RAQAAQRHPRRGRGPATDRARPGAALPQRDRRGHMMQRHPIALTVNGVARRAEVEPRRLLGELLREELGLTGTHLACEHGVCGACTVALDGNAARSCLMLALQAEGCSVETVESLCLEGGGLGPLQQAMADSHSFQCAFCAPGF